MMNPHRPARTITQPTMAWKASAIVLGAMLLPTPALLAQTAPAVPATSAAPAAPDASTRSPDELAAINVLVDRMTKAVLAADTDAYLACVDKADPIFLKEQHNWAKDLLRAPTGEFAMELANVRSDAPGSMIADVTMKWTMKGSASARSLKYAARFVDRDGAWLYAGENWHVLERDGVRVFFDEGRESTASTIIDVLPGVRTHVHEGFMLTIDRVQEVKLYSSMRHLQQSIYLSYTDGLSGWNEPGESIKMIASAHPGKDELTSVLAHEYGHVCTFELGPKANDAPWWVLEGVAELSSEHYDDGGQFAARAARRMAKTNHLRAWESLSDFHNTKPQDMQMVYTQGHAMLGYISERFGREKRVAWLKAMATGSSINDASKAAFGLGFTELDAQWRASLVAQSDAAPATEPAQKE